MSETCPKCRHAAHETLAFCPNMASDNDCACTLGSDPMTTPERGRDALREAVEALAVSRMPKLDGGMIHHKGGWSHSGALICDRCPGFPHTECVPRDDLRRILAEHPATGDEERCRCQIVGWSRDPFEPHIAAQPEWEQADDCPVHPLPPAVPDAGEGEGLTLLLRKAARHYLGLEERDYWDSGIASAQSAALLTSPWLAAHVAQAKAEALREAADALFAIETDDFAHMHPRDTVCWLHGRAARIEGTR